MTLILGMSTADGIYVSVDYRVTRGARPVGDNAIKFLGMQFPPYGSGPRAILAFTGLAVVHDNSARAVSTGTWLRETLRGETDTFNDSMAHLRERLNRDVGAAAGLIVNVVVIHGKRRFVGGLSNLARDKGQTGPYRPRREFAYTLDEITEPFAFANGSGAPTALRDGHFDLMRQQLSVAPRRIRDHMKLLATINRRVAADDASVSPFAQVNFVSGPEPRRGRDNQSMTFAERGESAPFEMPFLLLGLDLTEMTSDFIRQFEAFRDHDTPLGPTDQAILDRSQERRP